MSIITRKITLYPQGDKQEVDRVYKYIRNGMEVQSLMMNQCISAMYYAKINGFSKDEFKELRKHYSHVPNSKKGSPYTFDMAKYPTGLPIAGSVPRACDDKFKKACSDGLMYGKTSLPTFKNTNPLMVHNDYVNIRGTKIRSDGTKRDNGLYHDYDNQEEFEKALFNEKSPNIHIKFANHITFDLVLGNVRQSYELRTIIQKCFSGEYKICDSSIGFDAKSKKKIILNLSLEIPESTVNLDENTIVGVDLGMAIPAVAALNNNVYVREYIGNYDDFTRKRTQLQKQRRTIARQLKSAKGGHGRQDKLKHLDKIDIHERNFAHTYNHMVSSRVIAFALKNNAKYINLESLSGFSEDDKKSFVLRNWSYYELQTMIEYKAEKAGITVRYINPAYTSQTCSICGKRGIRNSQSVFTCSDPSCKIHTLYSKQINADFNGARNIAMSTDFVDEDKKENKKTNLKLKEKLVEIEEKRETGRPDFNAHDVLAELRNRHNDVS